ncbi:putative DNA-binding transcriptional regulator YafY [Streptomyces phaeoluteigriseus]
MREYASAAPDPYSARPDPAITGELVDAVAARRRVRIAYGSEAGNEWEAAVDPWSIVVRHGR